MAYTGAYAFGDSLVDSGNALKLAKWYGTLTLSDLPEGAPTADQGYFQGRFTNGYTFADLLSNKAIGLVTKPVFPFGMEDPVFGLPIDPFAGDPSGNNLNFAYGGSQIRQGGEVVPELDAQTDAFRDAVDGDAPPGALYMVTIGGNDVRSLAPAGSDPATQADAYHALDLAAGRLLNELTELVEDGAHDFLITGVPDVGLIPKYDLNGNGVLDGVELARSAAATNYSLYLDTLIRTQVVPELQAMGAKVTYVPLMDYSAANGLTITGALNANLPTIAYLNGLSTTELSSNLLHYQSLLFFDQVHPNAEAHALLAGYMQAKLTGTAWVETMPLLGADVDYRSVASIGVAGEVDSIAVAMVAGTTYTFQMLGVSSLTPYVLGQLGIASLPASQILGDPSMRLVSSAGTVLRVDDDSGAGLDATLSFDAAAAATTTLQLSAVGSLTGNYVLTATVSGAAMEAGNNYTVNNATTLVLEGAGGIGTDTISTSVSYALSAGSEIEVLQTTNARGKTAINLTGNEFNQTITGNSGANVLEGKGGADVMSGGSGNDRFVLSASAVSGPGNVDRITDYSKGDVVDVTQVLIVAAGTNVASGGYLRVTANGLVQVDMNGGGNEWVTLSTINGSGSVTVRYLSGGAATSVSLTRVNDPLATSAFPTSSVLTGAVAAAGLLSAPLAAEPNEAASDDAGGQAAVSTTIAQVTAVAIDAAAQDSPASATLTGADSGNDAAALRTAPVAEAPSGSDVPDLSAALAAPLAAVAQLQGDSGAPAPAAALSLAAQSVAMPAADALLAMAASVAGAGEARTTGEVARVLIDALDGGGAGPGHAVEALVQALPSGAQAADALAAIASVFHGASAPAFHAEFGLAAAMIHHDAPALA